jgi:hypothetical protein
LAVEVGRNGSHGGKLDQNLKYLANWGVTNVIYVLNHGALLMVVLTIEGEDVVLM